MHVKEHFKSCPKCKSSNIAFHTKHFVCEECGFDFYINASAAVAILITDDEGRLLLTKRKFAPQKGTLDLPGGFVDMHETAEDAGRREIKEELNLDIDRLEYICSFPNTYTYKDIEYYTLDLVFTARVTNFEDLSPNDDVSDITFIPPQEIDLKDIGFVSIRNIITKYKEIYQ